MRYFLIFLALFLALVFGYQADAYQKTYYEAKHQRVVDGDTIDAVLDLTLDVHLSVRIRLYGVNAPETRSRDLEEKRRGTIVKEKVSAYLRDALILRVHSQGRGKFGRLLAIVYKDKSRVSLNSLVKKWTLEVNQ